MRARTAIQKTDLERDRSLTIRRCDGRRRPGILCGVIPLASASGYVVIAAAVAFAAVLLWLLLRMEARDEAAERAEEEATRQADAERISRP